MFKFCLKESNIGNTTAATQWGVSDLSVDLQKINNNQQTNSKMYLNDIFGCKTLTLYESYNALMGIVVHWYNKKNGSEWNEAAHGGAKPPLKSVIKVSHFWLTYNDFVGFYSLYKTWPVNIEH